MAQDKKEEGKRITITGRMRLPYTWTFGRCATRFFQEFRDNKKIWGTRCSACKKVTIPPYSYCGRCFAECNEWVEVKDEGVLKNFVVNLLQYPGQPVEPPYILARIRLEGADTDFTHIIGETEPENLKTGIKVKAVWKEERTGILTDIKYFRPVESE